MINYESQSEIENQITQINRDRMEDAIDAQISFLTDRQSAAMEFEHELTRQIERNRITIEMVAATIDSLENVRKFTPNAWAKLDILDGCKCVPSAHFSRRLDRIEYIASYLRSKPDDAAALQAAHDHGMTVIMSFTDADIAEMHADALAVDDAQSEYLDWRT